MLHQIRFSKLFLLSVGERFQRPLAAGDFIVAENEGEACAQFVGLAEGFAEFLLYGRKLDTEARVAQIFRGANGCRVGLFTHPGDVQKWRVASGEWRVTSLQQRENQAIFADGEADALRRRAAEQLNQAVVAATATHSILRTKPLRGDFKRRAHVVVKAADEAPVFMVFHGAQAELMFHRGVMCRAVLAEMVADTRQLFDDRLLLLDLRVEDAQRIGLDAPLAVRPELVFHFQELCTKKFHVLRAALLVSDTVDIQLNAFQAQPLEKRHHHFDDFGVNGRYIGPMQYNFTGCGNCCMLCSMYARQIEAVASGRRETSPPSRSASKSIISV